MGNEEDSHAPGLQLPAGLHQLLDLFFAQGGRGLVHDNHFGVNQDGLGDFDHLLDAHAEGARSLPGIDVLAQGLHDLGGLFVHALIVQEEALLGPFVDKDIVRDAEELFNVQLLVHAGNARGGGLIGVFEDLPLSVDIDLALVRHVDAGENLNQRGFARAVLSDQSVDLARLHGQLHVVQGHNAGESFGYVSQLNYVFAHLIITSFSWKSVVSQHTGSGNMLQEEEKRGPAPAEPERGPFSSLQKGCTALLIRPGSPGAAPDGPGRWRDRRCWRRRR